MANADARIRVLLVDDSVELTAVEAEFIRIQPDMEVVGIAHDGVQGLEMATAMCPDVMILDVVMPHLDGLGVIEYLRRANGLRAMPRVLVLTAIGLDSVVSRMIAAGADYYMVKPFDFNELVDRVRRLALLPPDSSSCGERSAHTARPSQKVSEVAWEAEATALLRDMGIPANIRGYAYLRDAILMALEEEHVLGKVTNVIYPTIAGRYGTTASRVERAMRHAIEIAWTRGDIELINDIFGHTVDAEKGRPTNSAFIARMADKMRLDSKTRIG